VHLYATANTGTGPHCLLIVHLYTIANTGARAKAWCPLIHAEASLSLSVTPLPLPPCTGSLTVCHTRCYPALSSGLDCGGAYLKFVTHDAAFTPAALNGDTPYSVMFGPDKCGGTNKVHVIFRHQSPLDGEIEVGSSKHIVC